MLFHVKRGQVNIPEEIPRKLLFLHADMLPQTQEERQALQLTVK
jgi:hypothetical protein